MGKRFVPVRDADKRAIELYMMLREVEQTPLVDLRIFEDSKEPIFIGDRNVPQKWWTFTVDQFLRLNCATGESGRRHCFSSSSFAKETDATSHTSSRN
jgi:hypothetical protein